MSDTDQPITFGDLGLSTPILEALSDVGYETPSPIQAGAIPALLDGRDILGQAQTGTGKTAAFALPLLQNVDTSKMHPQVLVLAPTRELAIQVAEACENTLNTFRVCVHCQSMADRVTTLNFALYVKVCMSLSVHRVV